MLLFSGVCRTLLPITTGLPGFHISRLTEGQHLHWSLASLAGKTTTLGAALEFGLNTYNAKCCIG